MIKVNLLPPRFQGKGKKTKKNVLVLLLAIIIILAFSGGIIFLFNYKNTFNSEVNKVKKELQTQKEKNISYSEIEKKVTDLNIKLNSIKTVLQDRIYWSSVLKEIALNTPTDVFIENLTVSSKKEQNKISLRGNASSRRSIIKFKEELTASDYFKAVDFNVSNLINTNDPLSSVDFTITVYY